MSINKCKIHNYVQAYGNTLKALNIPVSEQDQYNIYRLIILLGELDDLYDQKVHNFWRERELQKLRAEMSVLIPETSLKQKTIDSLFESMRNEANNQKHSSLGQYLENSSITSGIHLIACYLASIFQLSPEIWFSRQVNTFGSEIGSIVRLANDYLDLSTSQNRLLAEASQENPLPFFPNKFCLKFFIAYKYILHKLRYYIYLMKLKYLPLAQRQDYLKAINCYESVLELGFKAYFVDREACRD